MMNSNGFVEGIKVFLSFALVVGVGMLILSWFDVPIIEEAPSPADTELVC